MQMDRLYTDKDVLRWKQGSAIKLEIFQEKIDNHIQGSCTPGELSMFLQNEALVAIAEGNSNRALGCFKASVDNDLILWSDLIAGRSRADACEWIEEMGFGPIVQASVVGKDLAIHCADVFAECIGVVKYEEGVTDFGLFLRDILKGETGDSKPVSRNIDQDLAEIALAVYCRDAGRLVDAIIAGAENWKAYIITDRGWPNSVCYQIGLAFTRIARELWLPDFHVSHSLLPDFVLEGVPDEDVGIRLPS
jgi:hypothetical protein